MTLKDVVEKILSTETLPGDQAHNEFSPMSVKVRFKLKMIFLLIEKEQCLFCYIHLNME